MGVKKLIASWPVARQLAADPLGLGISARSERSAGLSPRTTGADRVVAVSMLTKSICVRRYAVSPGKVDVVYNGIDHETVQPAEGATIEPKDKLVLFLGRITMQKGPEYFIAAAKRVLEKMENVKFLSLIHI